MSKPSAAPRQAAVSINAMRLWCVFVASSVFYNAHGAGTEAQSGEAYHLAKALSTVNEEVEITEARKHSLLNEETDSASSSDLDAAASDFTEDFFAPAGCADDVVSAGGSGTGLSSSSTAQKQQQRRQLQQRSQHHARMRTFLPAKSGRKAASDRDEPLSKDAAETALSNAELENMQLRQMLAQAKIYEDGLWSTLMQLKRAEAEEGAQLVGQSQELMKIPPLQAAQARLLAERNREHLKVTRERTREKSIQAQLASATHAVGVDAKAVGAAEMHVAALDRHDGKLVKAIEVMSRTGKVFQEQLDQTYAVHSRIETKIRSSQIQFQQAQIAEGEAEESVQAFGLTNRQLEQNVQLVKRRDESELRRAENAEMRSDALRKKLEAVNSRLEKERLQEQKIGKANNQTMLQLQERRHLEKYANKRSAMQAEEQIRHVASVVGMLRRKTLLLRRRAEDGDAALREARGLVVKMRSSLAESKADAKRLRGSGPWFEAKVSSAQQDGLAAAAEIKPAREERDADKAMLIEVQKKLEDLQQRYNKAVLVLHKLRVQHGIHLNAPAAPASLKTFPDIIEAVTEASPVQASQATS